MAMSSYEWKILEWDVKYDNMFGDDELFNSENEFLLLISIVHWKDCLDIVQEQLLRLGLYLN